MKRLSITKGFLIIIIVCSILLGGAFAFVLLNPNMVNILGSLTSKSETVTLTQSDYEKLIERYGRYDKLDTIREELINNYYIEADEEQLDEYAIKGLVAGLGDVYSSYYTPEEYNEISISLTGEYSGVGITMVQGEEYIQVLSVTSDSPAAKGGVTNGEYIVAVDGTYYSADQMDQCAAAIRGDKGTSVTVSFIKDGEQIDRTFVRDQIFTDTVTSEIMDDNIGYIWLYGFENGTYNDFVDALNDVKNTDGLIIDLRSNPGGLVESAENIADLFLDSATLYYTEDHNHVQNYCYMQNGTSYDNPVVVLVDENTASAAEILSAGLQDNNRVKVVGTQSFGKGIIQQLEPFEDGSALKLTMWQYFSPNGTAIHQVGVTPDEVVELTDDCYDENGQLVNDVQLEAALELVKSEIK